MSGPESNLWKSMKKSLPTNMLADRIENRQGGGIPDLDMMVDGISFKVELKAPVSIVTTSVTIVNQPLTCEPSVTIVNHPHSTNKVSSCGPLSILRPSQRAYFARRTAAGGVAYVLARAQRSRQLHVFVGEIDDGVLRLREVGSFAAWVDCFAALRLSVLGHAALRLGAVCRDGSILPMLAADVEPTD